LDAQALVALASEAAKAAAYFFVRDVYFFRIMPGFHSAPDKLIAQEIAVPAHAGTSHQNQYFFAHTFTSLQSVPLVRRFWSERPRDTAMLARALLFYRLPFLWHNQVRT
jgi:hypothetical protein